MKASIEKLTLFVGLVMGASLCVSSTAFATTVKKIKLPKGFLYPNGIALHPDGSVFIGSVTKGEITRLHPDGRFSTFFSGNPEVYAVTALRIDENRDRIWGASPDFLGVEDKEGRVKRRKHRFFVLSLTDGKLIKYFEQADNTFVNDLAIDRVSGDVFATDSNNGRVLRIDGKDFHVEVFAEDAALKQGQIGPAGIDIQDENKLIVGLFSKGRFFEVNRASRKVTRILNHVKFFHLDGMQTFSPTHLIALDCHWGGSGRVLSIDLQGARKPAVLAEGLRNPVNLTLSRDSGEIWVTEANIDHRLNPSTVKAVPKEFFVYRISTKPLSGSRLVR